MNLRRIVTSVSLGAALLLLAVLFGDRLIKPMGEANRTCNGIFADVDSGDIFCPYIEYLYHNNVVSGSNMSYFPSSNLKRQELAKIIVEAFDIETQGYREGVFPDVDSANTFKEYIVALKDNDIIDGYSDGTFKGENFVTRGEFMKFLVKAVQLKDPSLFPANLENPFGDVDIQNKFRDFISSVANVKVDISNEYIIGGYSDGTFRSDNLITRGEAAKVVTNTIKYGEFSNVDCIEYFCQDLFKKDGTYYKGEFFSALYPDTWEQVSDDRRNEFFFEESNSALKNKIGGDVFYVSNKEYNQIVFFTAIEFEEFYKTELSADEIDLDKLIPLEIYGDFVARKLISGENMNGEDLEVDVEILDSGIVDTRDEDYYEIKVEIQKGIDGTLGVSTQGEYRILIEDSILYINGAFFDVEEDLWEEMGEILDTFQAV